MVENLKKKKNYVIHRALSVIIFNIYHNYILSIRITCILSSISTLFFDTELDLHRIMSGFHGAFATGVASQQGTLTLPDTWFRPPFWDLLMLQLLRPNSSNLPCLYSTFHLEYPLVLSRFCFMNRGNAAKVYTKIMRTIDFFQQVLFWR